MLPRSITTAFSIAVAGRGDSYYQQRRVELLPEEEADTVAAVVSGTELYFVLLIAAPPGSIVATCTCPYAADQGLCKHIWATLRQAESAGALSRLLRISGANPELQAAFLPGADADDDELDDDNDVNADAEGDDESGRDDEDPSLYIAAPARRRGKSRHRRVDSRASGSRGERASTWKPVVENVRKEQSIAVQSRKASFPADRRIVYIVDLSGAWTEQGVPIELAMQQQRRDGQWKPPIRFRLTLQDWDAAPDPLDRRIAQMLRGAGVALQYTTGSVNSSFLIAGAAIDETLPLICQTGRCFVRRAAEDTDMPVAQWDDGPPWKLHLAIKPASGDNAGYLLAGMLRRDKDERTIEWPTVLLSAGVLIADNRIARFDHGGAFSFVRALRSGRNVRIPEPELPALLGELFSLPQRPELELPPEARLREYRSTPRPAVAVRSETRAWKEFHLLDPFFLYDDVRLEPGAGKSSVFDAASLTVVHRDVSAEQAALARLGELGAKERWDYNTRQQTFTIAPTRVIPVVAELLAEGWHVEADGAVYRAPVQRAARVSSGIDWFELDAGVTFGEFDVPLADLIEASRHHSGTITLPDGSHGIIPGEWLAQLGPLLTGVKPGNGAIRFTRSQTTLLDALLATLPEADVDATFAKARDELRSFSTVSPRNPPRSFRGSLRQYQREGLGWLHFLERFQLGGCLADDMGLGKTVQVLALLDARRSVARKTKSPSILVVPRSLVFNWFREAERFTPRLRLLDYTGTGRDASAITSGKVDVVVTTYGTVRRDLPRLAAIDFDYAILDESQAIKNAGSASAKAVRLLGAKHRLALTGTPIENRLDELWSLCEFLNPGMLGSAAAFSRLVRSHSGTQANGSAATANRDLLARALRPVILRRTKEQVAPELPERVEQTLDVELEGRQRSFYDELLRGYRTSVMQKVDRVGVAKSRMHILEALLRLRQAACHPVLADPRKAAAPSAKLDALLPALEEVVQEGHKALVFSQFTTFLALVRERLDHAGIAYEYLDGKTRDRSHRVDRFQSDPSCQLFLISLKAGGHGLNLTAADYVFILDPWWNPAVEAQAIDRAHRIGQERRVIATRIVARDTIESRILALQESKRALADAILGQDQGVLASIGKAELELLLG